MFNPSVIFQPQYVSNAAAALAFAANLQSPIPAGSQYQINQFWVANNSASPCWLKLYRVPSGGTANGTTFVCYIVIPVSSLAIPNVPISALWGIELQPGDTIVAQAQTASVLVAWADGGVNQG
jgi:hypothetical protein